MRCFHNTFTDIYFHLAAEEYLLKQETDSVFHALAGHSFCSDGKTPICTVGSEPGMGRKNNRFKYPVGFRVGELYIMIWVMII